MTKAILVGRIYFTRSVVLRRVRAGIQGRSLKAGTEALGREGVLLTGLFSMTCLACFLPHPKPAAQGQAALSAMSWTYPHQILVSKMCHRLAYRHILFRHFLQ